MELNPYVNKFKLFRTVSWNFSSLHYFDKERNYNKYNHLRPVCLFVCCSSNMDTRWRHSGTYSGRNSRRSANAGPGHSVWGIAGQVLSHDWLHQRHWLYQTSHPRLLQQQEHDMASPGPILLVPKSYVGALFFQSGSYTGLLALPQSQQPTGAETAYPCRSLVEEPRTQRVPLSKSVYSHCELLPICYLQGF